MSLVLRLSKIGLTSVVAGFLMLVAGQANAVMINFSVLLTEGTCTFSVDKTTLSLGTLAVGQITPSTVTAAQPFKLQIRNCTKGDLNLTPAVLVKGNGSTIDNRWMFRDSTSTSNNVGIMLFKKSTSPSYVDTEVKANDIINLAGKGVTPSDQDITFYSGLSCGAAACANNRQSFVGTVAARIVFELTYR